MAVGNHIARIVETVADTPATLYRLAAAIRRDPCYVPADRPMPPDVVLALLYARDEIDSLVARVRALEAGARQ